MVDRPAGVPFEAVWDSGDNEWVLADHDEQGRKHGLVTYWRPDGTLVNHCDMVHGVPHGRFLRYHESGAVSREGTFVGGKLHGVDRSHRSESPTTELAFPTGKVGDPVHVYEIEWVHGVMITARFYDRDGAETTETGERLPARPETVPATAVYLSKNACWLDGRTDEQGRQHGRWRTWNRDGTPVGETEMARGTEVSSHRFACAEDAEVFDALREGRPADALAAAGRWWQKAVGRADSEHLILAGELLARCLGDAAPSGDATPLGDARPADAASVHAQQRELYTQVAAQPGYLIIYSDEGRRCYRAQGVALDWLARDALAAGRTDEAVALCDRAIDIEYHFGPGPARVTKALALRRLGRDDEAFQLAREAVAGGLDTTELADLRADASFAAWEASIEPDTMTLDGAWQVLGERGERLAELATLLGPARPDSGYDEDSDDDDDDSDEDDESEEDDDDLDEDGLGELDAAWPIREVLGDRLSPELQRWLDIAPDLPPSNRGEFHPAVTSTVSAAVAAEDGTWLARLAGLFLPCSAVLIEDEQMLHATWVSAQRGVSLVLHTHQDEHGFWPSSPSLAAVLANEAEQFAEDGGLYIPAATRTRLERAERLFQDWLEESADPQPGLPTHLSVAHLFPRTGWITQLLCGVRTEHGLADAPGFDTWQAEREHTAAWPHLQAYWLLHHLVFGNHEELAALVAQAERRFPAVDELADLAAEVLAGDEPSVEWWDETAFRGLRVTAVDNGHRRLMSDAAAARVGTEVADRDGSDDALAEAWAELTASGDGSVAEVFKIWDLLTDAAGAVPAFEEQFAQHIFAASTDEFMAFAMRQEAGETSSLIPLMRRLGELVGPAYLPVFEAAVERGTRYAEDHATVLPGALVGLGRALGDFATFQARITQAITAERIGRRRRMEMAIVASLCYDQPAAREFLFGEASRYAADLGDGEWEYSTVSYPLRMLITLDPDLGGPLLSGALGRASFSGANWVPAVTLIEHAGEQRCASAAPGILAAYDRDLGNHSAGQRAVLTVAYAHCAGDAAVAPLSTRLDQVAGRGADADRCGLLAGLLTAEPTNPRWTALARTTIESLLTDRLDEKGGGAVISVLKAIDAAGVPGFGDLAGHVLTRVKDDQYIDDRLRTWLVEAATRL